VPDIQPKETLLLLLYLAFLSHPLKIQRQLESYFLVRLSVLLAKNKIRLLVHALVYLQ
jgi:hypothetical protein